MAIFTVHLPPTAPGAALEPEKIVFLREGFNYFAFVFGPFWLLHKRAWIAAAGWALLLTTIGVLAWKLRVPKEAISWVPLALATWLGFEGDRLVAWTLARRGYAESDVVIADDADEAEAVYFHKLQSAAPAPLAQEPSA